MLVRSAQVFLLYLVFAAPVAKPSIMNEIECYEIVSRDATKASCCLRDFSP